MAGRPLKILFLGGMAVGKSSLIQRITRDSFSADYKSTLGVALHELCVETAIGKQDIVLWDTDGDTDTGIFASPYVRGADAAMIVCDVSRIETIAVLERMAEGIEDRLPGRPTLGVINKIDLLKPTQQTIAAVDEACGRTVLTSAQSGEGVQEAIVKLVELCLRRLED